MVNAATVFASVVGACASPTPPRSAPPTLTTRTKNRSECRMVIVSSEGIIEGAATMRKFTASGRGSMQESILQCDCINVGGRKTGWK